MFGALRKNFVDVFQGLAGKGYLREEDIKQAMRSIRVALLSADVALVVVKKLIADVEKEALGQRVLKSLSPDQVLIKIVQEKLVSILQHNKGHNLLFSKKRPHVILMTGLQGSGKTTTTAKIARDLSIKSKKVAVCSVDVYRPAAIEQLAQLAQTEKISCFQSDIRQKPVTIAEQALKNAVAKEIDVLLVDTAGRLQIDQHMMDELKVLKKRLSPCEILFVADMMMGQEATLVAQKFDQHLNLTGIVMTRVDGDARGGAALSMGYVTGCPIKFLGTGESLQALEVFDPVRMADRLLDRGDVVGLVEEVEKVVDKETLESATQRMQKGLFTLNDMETQLTQMGRMGSFQKLLGLIPGMGALAGKNLEALQDEKAKKNLATQLAIIRSMTLEEKRAPAILNASRKRRIARGSGTEVQHVNRLLKQYQQMHLMMKRMKKMTRKKGMPALPGGYPFAK